MKRFRLKITPRFLIILALLGYVGYVVSCTQKDQVLLSDPNATNSTNLVSVKVSSPPTIDGGIESTWDKATKLSVLPTVPDPGNGLFTGYIGTTYPATLRSLYDDNNVYFLLEYDDPDKSVFVSTWYFDPVLDATKNAKIWRQEPSSKSFDNNGTLTRNGFGEDKIAMLWNIDGSTSKFSAQTCYASCHVFTPYMDYSTNPSIYKSNSASGNHYTNGPNEKIDMWWGHLGRDVLFGNMDDNYQDYAGGQAVTNLTGGNANGRHLDGLVVTSISGTWPNRPVYSSATDGSTNNTQTLTITGTATTTSVPKYVIPGATNYYAIKQSEVTDGTAKLITAVDIDGVLTYNGGTIDPNTDVAFQRTGDPVTGSDGTKCIPSYVMAPLVGGRADITCSAVYTGKGWIVEYKRALKTADALKQDVDFSGLKDQSFGLAIWDRSNYQHGIQPNLLLQFKKP